MDFREEAATGRRRKKMKRNHLTLKEKVEIVYKALIEKYEFKDIAKEYRSSITMV